MANADHIGPYLKPMPRAIEKHARKVASDAALTDAYKLVDARDKRTCRATGRTLQPGAVMPQMRLERHHLAKRSTHKGLVADSQNIVTLAADAHQLVEAGALLIEGDNADERLVFHWNREIVKPNKEPFKLLSKRKSQREKD